MGLSISQKDFRLYYASDAFKEIIKIAKKINKEEVITNIINNLNHYSWSGYSALLMNFDKLAEDQITNILEQLEESIEQGDFEFNSRVFHIFNIFSIRYYKSGIVTDDLFIKLLNNINQNINKDNYRSINIGSSISNRSNPELQNLVNAINQKIKDFKEAAKNNN